MLFHIKEKLLYKTNKTYVYQITLIQIKVVVIGSSNIDMVAQVSHLPAPGETIGDANFMQSLGGKGANQAVAAARLGGSVTFVTSLGNDMYADILKNHFKKEGITTDYIIDDVNNPTGFLWPTVAKTVLQ